MHSPPILYFPAGHVVVLPDVGMHALDPNSDFVPSGHFFATIVPAGQ